MSFIDSNLSDVLLRTANACMLLKFLNRFKWCLFTYAACFLTVTDVIRNIRCRFHFFRY